MHDRDGLPLGRYRFADIAIASEVPLPELPRLETTEPAIVFRVRPPLVGSDPVITWVHEWRQKDGLVTMACGHAPGRYHLRFADQTDFVIGAGGSTIECRVASDIPPATIRHYFLDQVLPRVLSQAGRMVLHASAVETPAGAIVFLGASGSGKSTVAAGFGRLGYPVLADDCVLVDAKADGFVGLPTYTGVRLWPDVVESLYGTSGPAAVAGGQAAKHRVDHWRDGHEWRSGAGCRYTASTCWIASIRPKGSPPTGMSRSCRCPDGTRTWRSRGTPSGWTRAIGSGFEQTSTSRRAS